MRTQSYDEIGIVAETDIEFTGVGSMAFLLGPQTGMSLICLDPLCGSLVKYPEV